MLLEGEEVKDPSSNKIDHLVRPRSSSVEVLDFSDGVVSVGFVCLAVSSCRSLRKLRHVQCCRDDEDMREQLYFELQAHHDTLSHLDADIRDTKDSFRFDRGCPLRHLAMHHSAIIADRLPAALRCLTLYVSNGAASAEDFVPRMRDIAHALSTKSEVRPRLVLHSQFDPLSAQAMSNVLSLPSHFATFRLKLELYSTDMLWRDKVRFIQDSMGDHQNLWSPLQEDMSFILSRQAPV